MKKRNLMGIALLAAMLCVLCACSDKEAVTVLTASGEILEAPIIGEIASDTGVYVADDNETATEVVVVQENFETEDVEGNRLLVHICGAVARPGVYELAEGDRICHAVELAGGFTQQADENYLNQAQKLTDGMRIYIPTKEETEQAAADTFLQTDEQVQGSVSGDGLININTATREQLCSLPGIGEGKAQNIIAYREEKGGYTSIEEIMNVEGIKEGLFHKIRDKITVS